MKKSILCLMLVFFAICVFAALTSACVGSIAGGPPKDDVNVHVEDETVIVADTTIEQFYGWHPNRVFVLADGSAWKQTSSEASIDTHAELPSVRVTQANSKFMLSIVGIGSVAVEELDVVVRSNIDGVFDGWDANKPFKLANGQVWEQECEKFSVSEIISPEAIIFQQSGSYYIWIDVLGIAIDANIRVKLVSPIAAF